MHLTHFCLFNINFFLDSQTKIWTFRLMLPTTLISTSHGRLAQQVKRIVMSLLDVFMHGACSDLLFF